MPTPRGLATETTTDERGTFTLSLAEGQHVLTVEAPGFTTQAQAIVAAVADGTPLEFVLQVAGVRKNDDRQRAVGLRVPASPPRRRRRRRCATCRSRSRSSPRADQDQLMMSIGDVVRYVPGITVHQGENNRDQVIIRGNSSSADFFVNGVRDDVQYYRDLYNLDRVEALRDRTR